MQEPKLAVPSRRLETPAGEVLIFSNAEQASAIAAARVAAIIRLLTSTNGKAVVGLPTGGTPVEFYKGLVAKHRAGELSFRDVTTYNLDEYYPISPCDPQSYRSYMHRHLFANLDIAPNHAHVLDGSVPEPFVAEHCRMYEHWIEADGGLDLQVLGIGRNGHIGFNEPSDVSSDEARATRTRLVSLHPVTRADAALDFGGEERNVPPHALTMGIGTILAARSIVVLAFGSNKAQALAGALSGSVSATLPASLLQTVGGRVTWFVDESAAADLK